MARTKADSSKTETKRMRTATSPEAREAQMISLAVDCAEEQLKNRTASASVIVHYLKLATEKEKLEQEKLRKENNVLDAKAAAYKSAENIEALYRDAINAMKSYSGRGGEEDEE